MAHYVAASLLLLLPIIAVADADDPKFQDAPRIKPAKIEGDVRFLHPDGILDGSFSQDGKYLVTLSRTSDYTIRLWELATGKLVQRFEASSHGGSQRPVLSPDNSKLYSGRYEVRIWDVRTGKIDTTIPAQVWTLSHDGKRLVTLNQRILPNEGKSKSGAKVRTDGFDVKTFDAKGKPLRTLLKLPGVPHGLTLSRDGSTLAVRSEVTNQRRINILDLTVKIPEGKYVGSPKGIGDHFALSADGRYLAVSAPFKSNPRGTNERAWITVLDLKKDQKLVHQLQENKGEINHLEFLTDGRLLSTDSDASFIVWQFGEYVSYVKHFRGDLRYVLGARVTADAKKVLVIPTNTENRPLLLDLTTGKLQSLARPSKLPPLFPEPKKNDWEGDKINLGNMYLRLPDGRWLHHRNYDKQQMWLWLLDKDKSTKLHAFSSPSPQVHISADGERLYQVRADTSGRFPDSYYLQGQRFGGGGATCVHIWSLKTFKEITSLGGNIPCGNFWVSPDEKSLAIAHADNAVRIWDIPTGQVKYRLELPPMASYFGGKAYFSPDSRSFIRETAGIRVTWNVREKGKEIPKGRGK